MLCNILEFLLHQRFNQLNLIIYFFSLFRPLETTMSAEKTLIKHLVRNYKAIGNGGRPVLNVNDSVNVEFGLGLIQMDLDEKYKVLTMSMWSRYVSILFLI